MNRLTLPLIGFLVVLVWLVQASLFTVEQTERVLVVQFGEVVRVDRRTRPVHENSNGSVGDQFRQTAARRRTSW